MTTNTTNPKQPDQLDLLNKAIRTATVAHTGQVRKSTQVPYIVHPYAVAMLAQTYANDAEVTAACLLHDVLEDVPPTIYSEENMRADFGDTITDMVKVVSEPKTAGEKERPWRERKDSYLARVRETSQQPDHRALVISCADKICNLNDILKDYQTRGDDLWQIFNGSKAELLWYYESCLTAVRDYVPAPMAEFYTSLVRELEQIVYPNYSPEQVQQAVAEIDHNH